MSAGLRLADLLVHLADRSPLVLGIPRGGVEVAAPVATALGARLGPLHALKVSAPGHPELAIGSVAPDGIISIDELSVRRLGLSPTELDAVIEAARSRLERRQGVFGPTPPVDDAVVIVVDDGVATGATLRSALEFVRRAGARTVVCAVPVGPPQTIEALSAFADEVVCPLTPESFRAVGEWYDEFPQATDADVLRLLAP